MIEFVDGGWVVAGDVERGEVEGGKVVADVEGAEADEKNDVVAVGPGLLDLLTDEEDFLGDEPTEDRGVEVWGEGEGME